MWYSRRARVGPWIRFRLGCSGQGSTALWCCRTPPRWTAPFWRNRDGEPERFVDRNPLSARVSRQERRRPPDRTRQAVALRSRQFLRTRSVVARLAPDERRWPGAITEGDKLWRSPTQGNTPPVGLGSTS